jgi:ComEC/Rec2-related protein
VTRWAGSLQLALALGAGLATGLAHFPDPVSIAIATVSAAWLSRQWSHAFLAVAIVLAIAWGAALRRGGAQSCANLLPLGEHTLQLRLVDPAHGTARAVPLGVACDGVVRTRWPSNHRVAAGVTATVVARWLPRSGFLGRPQGTLLVRRLLNQDGQPGLLARSRTAVSEATSRWFGERAGLVNALVSGHTGGIAPEIRDRFAAAGLIHVLSISGFHMGLIAFWLVLSLRLATVPPRHAEIIAAGVVLGYTAWLGWPPPATRAAALFAVTVLTRRRQRAARPDALLGASALVVLAIDPWSIVDLGAWLSFAAMAGLLWATQWYRRVAVPRPIL